jgi:EAL domain-containing protein (putative c-di-GMP-specific phosphodiesterase class I)
MSEPTISRALPQKDGSQAWLFGPWQLRSAFQPIFSLKTGKAEIAGFEGLIRPALAGRLVSPKTFFDNIEPSDRMNVETITRNLHLANAPQLPIANALMFVNIDPSAFNNILDISNSLADIRRLWVKSGKPAGKLVCEIIEKKVKTPALLYSLADAIRANGFRLAIDDYGAAHSDAARVMRLQPDIVKFDGHWVTRLMSTKAGYSQVKDMAATMHERRIETVFEGIETLEQLELSQLCQVTYVQGYVLARPEIAPTNFGRFAKSTLSKALDSAISVFGSFGSSSNDGFRPLT